MNTKIRITMRPKQPKYEIEKTKLKLRTGIMEMILPFRIKTIEKPKLKIRKGTFLLFTTAISLISEQNLTNEVLLNSKKAKRSAPQSEYP